MRRTLVYPAVLTPAALFDSDETGFVASFPDLPEAVTQGETEVEALREAADCLEEAIANRMRRRLEVPTPSPVGEGQHPVSILSE